MVADTYEPITTLSRSRGRLRARYAARQVVSDGMKSPCTKRAATSSQIPRVAAQSRLAAATTTVPPSRMGRMGYRSERTPKGRFAMAMPRMTAETVSDAVDALMPNSTRMTGSTGCVM
jgi:hypothetical protein